MIRTLTASRYEALRKDGYAGPAVALLPSTLKRFRRFADWDGGYWAMVSTADGTVVAAINIRD